VKLTQVSRDTAVLNRVLSVLYEYSFSIAVHFRWRLFLGVFGNQQFTAAMFRVVVCLLGVSYVPQIWLVDIHLFVHNQTWKHFSQKRCGQLDQFREKNDSVSLSEATTTEEAGQVGGGALNMRRTQ